MKVTDGKIVEITEQELYRLYLDRHYDMVMPFDEYRYYFEEAGCVVINDVEID